MSDLDVRRMTRELLRTGLNAEEVLDAVLAELAEVKSKTVLVRHRKSAPRPEAYGIFPNMVLMTTHYSVEFVRVPPLEPR